MLDLVHLTPVAQWPARRAFADCHIRWSGDDQGISTGQGAPGGPGRSPGRSAGPDPKTIQSLWFFRGEETLELFDCMAQRYSLADCFDLIICIKATD
jgi:hypothetical protein